jgi:4'-phosphopantetheinyl transferase EntD
MRLSAEELRRGLPSHVGVGIRYTSEGQPPPLHAVEEEALGSRAVEARRAYFAFGRAAARDALHELGISDAAIGRGPAGEPLWPPGVVGAISHAGDVATAIVGRWSDYAGLGVDVEQLSRGPSPRAARLVCRPTEMEWVDVESGTERLTMLFSAKEAVFKALYPIERVWLGFADAELAFRADLGGFEARLIKSAGDAYPAGFVLQVRSRVVDGLVVSTTFVAAHVP